MVLNEKMTWNRNNFIKNRSLPALFRNNKYDLSCYKIIIILTMKHIKNQIIVSTTYILVYIKSRVGNNICSQKSLHPLEFQVKNQ